MLAFLAKLLDLAATNKEVLKVIAKILSALGIPLAVLIRFIKDRINRTGDNRHEERMAKMQEEAERAKREHEARMTKMKQEHEARMAEINNRSDRKAERREHEERMAKMQEEHEARIVEILSQFQPLLKEPGK